VNSTELDVLQRMLLGDDADKHFPFLGQGSEQDHSLDLGRNDNGRSGETLEGSNQFVNLGARVLSRVEANVKGLLEVLVNAGGSGRAIAALQVIPNIISIRVREGSELLLNRGRYP
jgi:hypothetical protein